MNKHLSVTTYFISALCILMNVFLWLRVILTNPSQDVWVNMSLLVIVPMILAIVSLSLKKAWLMYVAFICALPMGLYLIANNGIWPLLGSLEGLYLLVAILMSFDLKKVKHG